MRSGGERASSTGRMPRASFHSPTGRSSLTGASVWREKNSDGSIPESVFKEVRARLRDGPATANDLGGAKAGRTVVGLDRHQAGGRATARRGRGCLYGTARLPEGLRPDRQARARSARRDRTHRRRMSPAPGNRCRSPSRRRDGRRTLRTTTDSAGAMYYRFSTTPGWWRWR